MISSNINFNKEIFVFITRGFTGEKFWKKINVNYDKNMEKLWEEFIVETNFENLLSPGFYIGKKREPHASDSPEFGIFNGKDKVWKGEEAYAIANYVFGEITEIDVKLNLEIDRKLNELPIIQFIKLGKIVDPKQKFILQININNNESIIYIYLKYKPYL